MLEIKCPPRKLTRSDVAKFSNVKHWPVADEREGAIAYVIVPIESGCAILYGHLVGPSIQNRSAGTIVCIRRVIPAPSIVKNDGTKARITENAIDRPHEFVLNKTR